MIKEYIGEGTDLFEATAAAKEYADSEDNLVAGANIAGFLKVADAMKAQGVL